jgi:2'-5' RNA ligase
MYAIISRLDETHDRLVRDLWRQLETDCGLTAIQKVPIPHFTWAGAAEYDQPRLEDALRAIARAAQPFTVRCGGVGVFPGEKPVIYAALVKDADLLHFHERVWQVTGPLADAPYLYYSPELWMPHITLAYGDVTPENAPCAIARLFFEPLRWEFPVDNLCIVQPSDKDVYDNCQDFYFGK